MEGSLSHKTGFLVKGGLALSLSVATLAATMSPTYAGDRGGAIAAGVIGGLAVGALAGSAAAGAYGPGPGYYAPPPPRYVEPAYAPPRCHRVFVRTWDPYEGVYVDRPRRVCDY